MKKKKEKIVLKTKIMFLLKKKSIIRNSSNRRFQISIRIWIQFRKKMKNKKFISKMVKIFKIMMIKKTIIHNGRNSITKKILKCFQIIFRIWIQVRMKMIY